MAEQSTRGALYLTAAQAWHALSGYLIFITAARLLGEEAFGDFGLVIWTMTTLEVFVIDSVPRAVSWSAARRAGAGRGLVRCGLVQTLRTGLLLAIGLVLLAPVLGSLWRDEGLTNAVRLSSLDFVAFGLFAVLTQFANGRQRYGQQTRTWLTYSTAKLACVLGALAISPTVTAGVIGYVLASALGSLGAALQIGRHLEDDTEAPPQARELWSFGLPISLYALALMAMVNADLWALRRTDADARTIGAYTAAATLARALFFIFKAVGDALFPAVAAASARGDRIEAGRVAHKGLAQLGVLLFPLVGLAWGASDTILKAVYGEGAWGLGASLLGPLCLASAAITVAAVATQLVAAKGHARVVAILLGGVLVAELCLLFVGLPWSLDGADAVAWSLVIVSGLFLVTSLTLLVWALGFVVPLAAWGAAAGLAWLLQLGLHAWHPEGWWVFPFGGLLYAFTLGLLMSTGLIPKAKPKLSS